MAHQRELDVSIVGLSFPDLAHMIAVNNDTKRTALVTGGTGFVGSSVVLAYVAAGFFVHTTSRSEEKAKAWLNLHSDIRSSVKFFIVKDITHSGAFSDALQGVEVVAHTGES